MKKIGIIGAGIMAAGMAQNFLKHGYTVYVWNRTPDRLAPLIKAGAEAALTPRDVARHADIVIECVGDDKASKSVWLGSDGIVAGAMPDTVLITSASLSLKWTDELAALCHKQKLTFLDMPLTGGRGGAEQGTLSLLVGGDKAVLASIKSDLEAISAHIYHFGPAGSGMRFKLLLNTLSAIHMNAAAQAAALAEQAGIAKKDFYHAIFDATMGPASPSTGILVRDRELPPETVNFAVKWITKDLRYATAMAEQYGADFDLLNDTFADFNSLVEAGDGDRDWTRITAKYEAQEGQ